MIRRTMLTFRFAKPKPSIQLGPWNIVVLTAAGFWVLILIVFPWRLTSELIASYFQFGSPAAQIAAGADAIRIPRAQLIAMYLQHLPTWLALGTWSLITGACLAMGVTRYPVGRGAGILAFIAGAFMYITAVPVVTKTFSFYALETSLIQWLLMGVYSMGAPWLLGRAISRLSR
jgi:hypothetical protein